MFCTPNTQIPHHAPVEKFSLLRTPVMCGKRLHDVKTLQESIARYGLLSPIIAMKRAGQLIVIDGRKRLAAIRRLMFNGQRPRSLAKIPYLLVDEMDSGAAQGHVLVANAALYAAILERFRGGDTVSDLAQHFQISHQCVRDSLSLSRLAAPIRSAFFSRMISFSQARAFAAHPDMAEQLAQFYAIGPFATPSAILAAVENTRETADAVAA